MGNSQLAFGRQIEVVETLKMAKYLH